MTTHDARIVWALGPWVWYYAHNTGAHGIQVNVPVLKWTVVLCFQPYSRLWHRQARRFGWSPV